MEGSEKENLAALLTAVENRDVASTIRIWRDMTELEQEAVVLAILRRLKGQAEPSAETLVAHPQDDDESRLDQTGNDTSVQADQTELIPKSLEDLRGLSASDNDTAVAQPAVWTGSTNYWSRWRQRWKWSVLVTVWAMATIFAFNGAFDAFGPSEWVVGILWSVVGSGLLIGTLANFAVALIPRPAPNAREER